jgi:hypothetical protein
MRVFPAVTMVIMAMPDAAARMQQACAVGGFSKGSCSDLYNSIVGVCCNNDPPLPTHTHTHTHTYIYIYICINIYVNQ